MRPPEFRPLPAGAAGPAFARPHPRSAPAPIL